jgi:hypothetical protein
MGSFFDESSCRKTSWLTFSHTPTTRHSLLNRKLRKFAQFWRPLCPISGTIRLTGGWRIGGDRGRERALRQEKYSKNIRFVRLQRDQRLTLWYIGKRKQGFLRNHVIPQCTFLTPVGNRCITPCVCVKEPSRSRGVILTAGGLSVHKGTVFCRNIKRHIQRYWIWRRLCRSISC